MDRMEAEFGQGQEKNKTEIMPGLVRRRSDALDAVLDWDERRGMLRSSAVQWWAGDHTGSEDDCVVVGEDENRRWRCITT